MSKFAVKVKSKKHWNEVMECIDRNIDAWDKCKKESCIAFNDFEYDSFSEKSWYKSQGIEIIGMKKFRERYVSQVKQSARSERLARVCISQYMYD